VLSFFVFVIGVLIVSGLLFLGASLLMGRGETQPPTELDRSPVELPDDRPVIGDDVRALRLSPAFRGYRMTEVDWLIDQFAQILDDRDAELATLRGAAHPPEGAAGKQSVEPRAEDDTHHPDEERPDA
jgi:DivIVA domain-containing protein